MAIREGTQVKWSWGNGAGSGKVLETFDREVTRTIKGSEITRKGGADDPALLIDSDSGDQVLKLRHEVERAD